MTNIFQHHLSKKKFLVADGATGTQLFTMGLQSGDCPELWNEKYPEKIEELYKKSIDAGADIFLSNSFGSNFSRLKLHGIEKLSFKLSKQGAAIGRNIIDKLNKDLILAGSIGPTGEIFSPIGNLTYEAGVEIFHTQAEGLKEGGVDVLWIETISDLIEFQAAAEAARLTNLPWCGTMSFDTSGRTMMGTNTIQMTNTINDLTYKPIAYGANCGVGAADLVRTLLSFEDNNIPIIAKGNAGIPKYSCGKIYYDGTPAVMADYAALARNAGASIIGGCCGTTPKHLTAMKIALETRVWGKKPTLKEIKNKLGEFSSISDGVSEGVNLKRKFKNQRHKLNL